MQSRARGTWRPRRSLVALGLRHGLQRGRWQTDSKEGREGGRKTVQGDLASAEGGLSHGKSGQEAGGTREGGVGGLGRAEGRPAGQATQGGVGTHRCPAAAPDAPHSGWLSLGGVGGWVGQGRAALGPGPTAPAAAPPPAPTWPCRCSSSSQHLGMPAPLDAGVTLAPHHAVAAAAAAAAAATAAAAAATPAAHPCRRRLARKAPLPPGRAMLAAAGPSARPGGGAGGQG